MVGEKRILVVDDDPDIVETLKTVLESSHYKVSSASSKEEALKVLEEDLPDLIILDVMMAKETDGFHLAYQLRSDSRTAQIPLMMLTAIGEKFGFKFSPEEDKDYLPVDEYAEKPIDPQALLDKVGGLLSKTKQ